MYTSKCLEKVGIDFNSCGVSTTLEKYLEGFNKGNLKSMFDAEGMKKILNLNGKQSNMLEGARKMVCPVVALYVPKKEKLEDSKFVHCTGTILSDLHIVVSTHRVPPVLLNGKLEEIKNKNGQTYNLKQIIFFYEFSHSWKQMDQYILEIERNQQKKEFQNIFGIVDIAKINRDKSNKEYFFKKNNPRFWTNDLIILPLKKAIKHTNKELQFVIPRTKIPNQVMIMGTVPHFPKSTFNNVLEGLKIVKNIKVLEAMTKKQLKINDLSKLSETELKEKLVEAIGKFYGSNEAKLVMCKGSLKEEPVKNSGYCWTNASGIRGMCGSHVFPFEKEIEFWHRSSFGIIVGGNLKSHTNAISPWKDDFNKSLYINNNVHKRVADLLMNKNGKEAETMTKYLFDYLCDQKDVNFDSQLNSNEIKKLRLEEVLKI